MTQNAPASTSPNRMPSLSDHRVVRAAHIAVAFFIVAATLWTSWRRFPAVWTDDRNNGFAIAALTAWVLWRDRALLRGREPVAPWAIPLLLGLSLLWMVAVAMSAQTIHLTLVPGILLVFSIAVHGEGSVRQSAQVAALFSLALPAWGLLVPALQGLTVAVNRALLFATRIPASVEGSLIHLQSGTLQVANSCAGFNFLMVGLTIGAAYAFLFTEAWQVRLKIVLAAGALSIVSNWMRVFGLVVVGHVTKMRSSLMHDHVLYGWLIFAATIPILFYVAAKIERAGTVSGLMPVRLLPAEAVSDEFHSSGGRVLLATGVALIGPLLLYALGVIQPHATLTGTAPGVLIADQITMGPPDSVRWIPSFSGEKERRSSLMKINGKPVQLDRYLYASGNDAAEMIGSENHLAADSLIAAESDVGPLDDRLRMTREVLLRTPDKNGRVAWYWYVVSDVVTYSPLRAKLLELWAFVTLQSSSQIVVLSAACELGDCQGARMALYTAATGREMPAPAR